MTFRRRAAFVASGLLFASAVQPAPAFAQGTLLERLFGLSTPAAPEPAKPPAAAQDAAVAAKPAPVPPKRPAVPAAQPAGAQVPPSAPQAAPPPITTAAAPATAAVASGPLTERQIVERANGYFNAITSLTGTFAQVGGDGRRLSGKLYLQRPGKVRFEYDSPATLEVVADGTTVAVRDSKLATQDVYPIGQTPLKFLLRDKIEFGRDLKVTEVATDSEEARISLEDRSTLGGTSKITLFFNKDISDLSRWKIVDPQGFQTTVALANLERNARVDQQLFVINYQRVLNDR
jgi:outer membrane lipoprotein-sorting protein